MKIEVVERPISANKYEELIKALVGLNGSGAIKVPLGEFKLSPHSVLQREKRRFFGGKRLKTRKKEDGWYLWLE